MLGRVNEASLLELLNCVTLLTYLERAMKDLCFKDYRHVVKLLFKRYIFT
jgi:hypothetical protein